ncbi:MAG: hypothetical protein LBJ17_01690 [Dysgonamonadaceae bacterium]|jgi:hypothetical protein|nr:hypothetical protein [Dysgonamonadaceae bacterium]
MALQKEIWVSGIIPLLFADNSFAVRSVNHSPFVTGATVHVPNAGEIEAARKTRLRTAGSVNLAAETADLDLEYPIQKYYVGPYVIPNLESVELSYDKRGAIIKTMADRINDAVCKDLLTNWVPGTFTKVATTGGNVPATAPSATGNRKALLRTDIINLRMQFDRWNMPQAGRCLLLDADMGGQLLVGLTESQAAAYLSTADAKTGKIGTLFGFDIYERGSVLVTTASGGLKSGNATATDSVAGLAWSESAVSRALGEVNVLGSYGDAAEFGDVVSVSVRAGGSAVRSDGKGVVVLYQAT